MAPARAVQCWWHWLLLGGQHGRRTLRVRAPHTHQRSNCLPSRPPSPSPGACYCNSTFAHGRIPADPLHPPGTPPQRRGRPIFHFCRRSEPSRWGDIPPESLYGPEGWCEVRAVVGVGVCGVCGCGLGCGWVWVGGWVGWGGGGGRVEGGGGGVVCGGWCVCGGGVGGGGAIARAGRCQHCMNAGAPGCFRGCCS